MRLLIITSNPDIESTPWWPVIARTPGIGSVMILRENRPRSAPASLRKNLKWHGPLWIPYRAAMLLIDRARSKHQTPGEPIDLLPFKIERIEVPSLRDPAVLERVRAWQPHLGLSIGAPILKEELFAIPAAGTVNLHLGKVPEFRGAPPAFWELWEGATEIGATIHRVDVGLDTGPILAQATAPIHPDDSLRTVSDRAVELGALVLGRTLHQTLMGRVSPVAQTGNGRTYRSPSIGTQFRLWARIAWRRARQRLSGRNLVKHAIAYAFLFFVRPVRDLYRSIVGRHPVRIFTYHRVTTLTRDGMTIAPREFEEQVAYLTRTHDIVSLDRALGALDRGERLTRPMGVITFDDAYTSVFRAARPILKAFSVPATVFASSALVETDRRYLHDQGHPLSSHFAVMNWSQLELLRNAGWCLGGHTANHVRVAKTGGAELQHELIEPLEALRLRFQIAAPAFAYPFGGIGDITAAQIDYAISLGYRAVLSNFGGDNVPGDSTPADVRRFDLGGNHARAAWKSNVHGLDLARLGRRMVRTEVGG